ncbi:hypothetical protein Ancab_005348 [Ancistrocladus abbreviatus]
MTEPQNPKTQQNPLESSTPPPNSKISVEVTNSGNSSNGSAYSGHKVNYPNPPDAVNPDPSTLRDQWRYAIRQYSRWYSHAWGTAILAGAAFFALGWIIKGSNPLPSFHSSDEDKDKKQSESSASGQPHGAARY